MSTLSKIWKTKPNPKTIKQITVYGEQVQHKIPEDIKKNELLGRADKIALHTYRKHRRTHPNLEKITVSLNCKDHIYWTLDLEDTKE